MACAWHVHVRGMCVACAYVHACALRKMRVGPAKKYTVDATAAVAVDAIPPVAAGETAPRVWAAWGAGSSTVASALVRTNRLLTGGGGGGVRSGEAMSSMSRRQYLK